MRGLTGAVPFIATIVTIYFVITQPIHVDAFVAAPAGRHARVTCHINAVFLIGFVIAVGVGVTSVMLDGDQRS